MAGSCSVESCSEGAIASLEENAVCYRHFLKRAYARLESISMEMQDGRFMQNRSEQTGHFLEECIREAADIACVFAAPNNLERARVLDVLLWASELHALLRRGPRIPARVAILLRSDESGGWEEKTETQLLSLHGAQVVCTHELKNGEVLTCIRVDNAAKIAARVVWARRRVSGETEAGIEFLNEVNFWNLGHTDASPLAASSPPN